MGGAGMNMTFVLLVTLLAGPVHALMVRTPRARASFNKRTGALPRVGRKRILIRTPVGNLRVLHLPFCQREQLPAAGVSVPWDDQSPGRELCRSGRSLRVQSQFWRSQCSWPMVQRLKAHLPTIILLPTPKHRSSQVILLLSRKGPMSILQRSATSMALPTTELLPAVEKHVCWR